MKLAGLDAQTKILQYAQTQQGEPAPSTQPGRHEVRPHRDSFGHVGGDGHPEKVAGLLGKCGLHTIEDLARVDLDELVTRLTRSQAPQAIVLLATAWAVALRSSPSKPACHVEPKRLDRDAPRPGAVAYVAPDGDMTDNRTTGSRDALVKNEGKLQVYLSLNGLPDDITAVRILNRSAHPGSVDAQMAEHGETVRLDGRALEGNKGFVDLDAEALGIHPGQTLVIQGVDAHGNLTRPSGDFKVAIPKIHGFLDGPQGPGLCPSQRFVSGWTRMTTDCAIEQSVYPFVPGKAYDAPPLPFTKADIRFQVTEPFPPEELRTIATLANQWGKWVEGIVGHTDRIDLEQLCTIANKDGADKGIKAAAQALLDSPDLRRRIAIAGAYDQTPGKFSCVNDVRLADLQAAEGMRRRVRINIGPQPPKTDITVATFGKSPYPGGGRYALTTYWSSNRDIAIDDEGWLTIKRNGETVNFAAGQDLDIVVRGQRIQINVPKDSTC